MSKRKLTRYQDGEAPLGADSWFISFGDLLTLLLCFFLLLTPGEPGRSNKIENNQSVNAGAGESQSSGTDLALKVIDRNVALESVVPVWRHFLVDGEVVQERRSVQEQWVNDVRTQVLSGRLATVKLCEAGAEREVISRMVSKIVRGEALASRVQFEVGQSCDSWRAHAVSQGDLVAVVTFSET
jgi:hypothetical protein